MPYPFLGLTGRNYVQYLDEATGRILQAQPGRDYSMQPVPGAGDVSVPPGDGLWGPASSEGDDSSTSTGETPEDETPTDDASAPPGAPDQLARTPGRAMKPAADAAQEG